LEPDVFTPVGSIRARKHFPRAGDQRFQKPGTLLILPQPNSLLILMAGQFHQVSLSIPLFT
jgi:hypothetical protein